MMEKSPVNVHSSHHNSPSRASFYSSPAKSPFKGFQREYSVQSDDTSSHCSSVECVLELRKPDPEAVLLELGFGPPKNSNLISKIPNRFLQPSKLLSQIDLNKFLEQYGVCEYPDQHSAPQSPAKSRPKTA